MFSPEQRRTFRGVHDTIPRILRGIMEAPGPITFAQWLAASGVRKSTLWTWKKLLMREGIVYIAGYVWKGKSVGRHEYLYAMQTTPYEFPNTEEIPYRNGKPMQSLDCADGKTGV